MYRNCDVHQLPLFTSFTENTGEHFRTRACRLTASMMHSKSSDAPTRLVVFLGHRTSEDAPDAVPSGQYDPTGHLFWKHQVGTHTTSSSLIVGLYWSL